MLAFGCQLHLNHRCRNDALLRGPSVHRVQLRGFGKGVGTAVALWASSWASPRTQSPALSSTPLSAQAPTATHALNVEARRVGTAYKWFIWLSGFGAHQFYSAAPGSPPAPLYR